MLSLSQSWAGDVSSASDDEGPAPGDVHNLQRFVAAQERPSWGGNGQSHYSQALAELRDGYKASHWIWFVLPQLVQLGQSHTAKRYGITGADEARAYLEHPVLGPRVRECCAAVAAVERPRSAVDIMGHTDAVKLRSCATLFARVADDDDDVPFVAVLKRFYQGGEDSRTVALLEQERVAKASSALDWAAIAEAYDGSFWDSFSPWREVMAFVDGEGAVLDVGCGTGALVAALSTAADQKRVIQAVDGSPEMLARVRIACGGDHAWVSTHCVDVGTATERDYPGRDYDFVVSSIALQFTPVPDHTLGVLAQLLDPNCGTLVVAVWGRRDQCTAVDRLERALGRKVSPANWRLSDLDHLKAAVGRAFRGTAVVEAHRMLVERQEGADVVQGWRKAAVMLGVESLDEDVLRECAQDSGVKDDVMEVNIVVARRKGAKKRETM